MTVRKDGGDDDDGVGFPKILGRTSSWLATVETVNYPAMNSENMSPNFRIVHG